jgi:hypothetical protein
MPSVGLSCPVFLPFGCKLLQPCLRDHLWDGLKREGRASFTITALPAPKTHCSEQLLLIAARTFEVP